MNLITFYCKLTHLEIPAVTLLSLFYVSVATLLPSIEHLHLRHVEETHTHSLIQTHQQVFLTAWTEHSGEGVPAERKDKES